MRCNGEGSPGPDASGRGVKEKKKNFRFHCCAGKWVVKCPSVPVTNPPRDPTPPKRGNHGLKDRAHTHSEHPCMRSTDLPSSPQAFLASRWPIGPAHLYCIVLCSNSPERTHALTCVRFRVRVRVHFASLVCVWFPPTLDTAESVASPRLASRLPRCRPKTWLRSNGTKRSAFRPQA